MCTFISFRSYFFDMLRIDIKTMVALKCWMAPFNCRSALENGTVAWCKAPLLGVQDIWEYNGFQKSKDTSVKIHICTKFCRRCFSVHFERCWVNYLHPQHLNVNAASKTNCTLRSACVDIDHFCRNSSPKWVFPIVYRLCPSQWHMAVV